MNEDVVRGAVVLAALRDLGTPYVWGGNDPIVDGGLDCSGAVLRWLRVGGVDLRDQTADELRLTLSSRERGEVEVGDLAFYGGGKATHVVLVIAPEGRAIVGANGGGAPREGESTEAREYRERMAACGARVRIEDQRLGGAWYRRDLLGFGRIPVGVAVAGSVLRG